MHRHSHVCPLGLSGDAPGSIVSQLVEGVAVLLHCNHRHCMSILGVHYTDTTLPMFLFPRAKYGTLKHTLLDLQENGLRSRFNRVSVLGVGESVCAG